jgi:cytochrome P450
MSIDMDTGPVRRVRSVPIHRALPRLMHDPAGALAEFAQEADGEIVRIDLGPFRPYLVTHPDHVQQVMRTEWLSYRREGMFWRPLDRIFGSSIMSDGQPWQDSRKILQPLFTSRYIAELAEKLADAIAERVTEWDRHARSGRPVDAAEEMYGIITCVVNQVLFGDKLSRQDGERLIPAYDTVAHSIAFRLFMPFLPYSLRVPGDRSFMRAVKTVDDVMMPVIRRTRADPDDNVDIVSVLCRSVDEKDEGLAERKIRDAMVGMSAAASETTAMIMIWLWLALGSHPEIAARLQAEIDDVVGTGPVVPEHVPRLRYTRMVLEELLRLYPGGWILPRLATEDGELGGVRIKAGSQVLISPYATQRLAGFWERSLEFDPERFAPDNDERRHKYAHFPFGGGPHQCLGQQLFYLEAPLVIANILSRFRVSVRTPGPFTSAWAASLRPKQRVELDISFAEHDRSGTSR